MKVISSVSSIRSARFARITRGSSIRTRRWMAGVTMAAGLLALTHGATGLQASTLVVGTPTAGGVDFVWIHDKGGWHIIPVDITLPGDALPGAKAVTIAQAISDKGYTASATTGGNVDIASGGTTGVDKWEYHSNSGEKDQAKVALVNIGTPQYFALGFDGTVSGTGFASGGATYSADIGFNSVQASSEINFASLADQTITGLLTATYDNLLAELPSVYQSSLVLDLVDDDIVFTLPAGAANAFVDAQSLDSSTGASIAGSSEPASTPEPSSLLLACLGALTILAGSWRWKVGTVG